MKLGLRQTAFGAIVVAAVLGSVLGTHALEQAVVRARDLYRVDTAGSQMESDLEYQTEESRRAFLYALAVSDPNDQLPYVAAAREASRQVDLTASRLRLVGAGEIAAQVRDFEGAWQNYDVMRDDIIALILVGDAPEALRVESRRGQPAFQKALDSLHQLKAALEVRARNDSQQVDATLVRSMVGLSAFLVSMLVIIGLLARTSRARQQALGSLHTAHRALAEARELERARASILEMVGSHATLGRTLEEIAGLSAQCGCGAGAAVWVGDAHELHYQAGAHLAREFTEYLLLHPPARPSGAAKRVEEFCRYSERAAGSFGLVASPAKELKDAAGERIGMLQMFAATLEKAAGGGKGWESLLEQMAHLASVAIENSLLYERLAFQAQHDALTSLPNRLLFQDRVQQALRLARRQQSHAAVIWIDLNKFKQTNDTLGHRTGDEVLCEVARRLTECLRQSDTVARVGGDEFTVLLQDLTKAEDAELVARKIVAALELPFQVSPRSIAVGASLGISLFPDYGDDAATLLRQADLAMYSAKRVGGTAYRMFRPFLNESMQRRVMIERDLKTACERNEMLLEYQPLHNLRGNLEGVEALLRWNHGLHGKISPAEFIPIAEETGLICQIGEWVLRTACLDGARWLSVGYGISYVAVNVSARQFAEGNFTAMVERTLAESGYPASRLELEITETALMNNPEGVIEQIEHLRRSGVRFAIDDFGTGYSSLSHLRNLPVDRVKIDRSFVKDLAPGADGSTTLVRGIISLAHNLRLQVVAEGVETAEQLSLLHALGCDSSQGFFLHRPMPAGALEELLGTLEWTREAGEREPGDLVLR